MSQQIDHPAPQPATEKGPAEEGPTSLKKTGLSARLAAWPAARSVATMPWRLWRALIACAYLAAAGFNTVYTLPRSDELDGYADGAWFGFLGDFMRDVFMPNGEIFMALVIVFEVAVAILIAGRGMAVDVGVVASVIWVLAVLPFLAWPYLITNIVLAVLQGLVSLRTYDSPVWLTRHVGIR